MDKEFASDFPNFFLPVAGSTIAENFDVKIVYFVFTIEPVTGNAT